MTSWGARGARTCRAAVATACTIGCVLAVAAMGAWILDRWWLA